MTKVTIEIDGKKCQAQPGEMVIQVADKEGIYIPRFCYHKKLSVAANCRMCLVDVEKAAKPLPACATPVQEGMIIKTKSAKARDAQRAIMEFLLINHPLDCPICDQGGACELQDVAMGYGKSVARYSEGKRAVEDKNLGPLISTDMTRCIHCTRCIRFGEEVAGTFQLGMIGRGEDSEVTACIEQSLTSEMSANVIDLCPVGALTSKPFRYSARAWELERVESIAGHDCVGSHIYVHRNNDQVKRVVPRDAEALNETWLSDRDRFSYCGLYADDRLAQPLIKQAGEWRQVDWQTALQLVATRIQETINTYGAGDVGSLISPQATIEEMYLLQKLMRNLGSNNIDHRIQQSDFSQQLEYGPYPGSEVPIDQYADLESILLIGSYLRHEQPIINHRVRQAVLKGAKVSVLHAIDFDYNYDLAHKIICSPNDYIAQLMGIAKGLLVQQDQAKFPTAVEWLQSVTPTKVQLEIATQLVESKTAAVILGANAQQHENAGVIYQLGKLITCLAGAKLAILTPGANSAGAWLAGALPHRSAAGITVPKPGLDVSKQLNKSLKAYILFGVEPELDCLLSAAAKRAMLQAEFVVAMTPFVGAAKDYADVILPTVPQFETAGTFVNACGEWQSFQAATIPFEAARPGWKILRVLGNLFHLDGFDQTTAFEVRDELHDQVAKMSNLNHKEWQKPHLIKSIEQPIQRVVEWPMYRTDLLIRRSQPLQASSASLNLAVYMNQKLAQELNLGNATLVKVTQGEVILSLPLVIDERIADKCVFIPAGFAASADLASGAAELKIEREA